MTTVSLLAQLAVQLAVQTGSLSTRSFGPYTNFSRYNTSSHHNIKTASSHFDDNYIFLCFPTKILAYCTFNKGYSLYNLLLSNIYVT